MQFGLFVAISASPSISHCCMCAQRDALHNAPISSFFCSLSCLREFGCCSVCLLFSLFVHRCYSFEVVVFPPIVQFDCGFQQIKFMAMAKRTKRTKKNTVSLQLKMPNILDRSFSLFFFFWISLHFVSLSQEREKFR